MSHLSTPDNNNVDHTNQDTAFDKMPEDPASPEATINDQAKEAIEKTDSVSDQEKEIIEKADPLFSAKKIEAIEKELNILQDKYMRLYSEFDNFKKRTSKEKISIIDAANKVLLQEILPVLDDFQRSLNAFKEKETSLQIMQEGIHLIHDKLDKLLQKKGVCAMSIQHGDEFNPELHEAITQMPTEDEALKGKIVEVVEVGYCLNDQVLRFAKVIIGA